VLPYWSLSGSKSQYRCCEKEKKFLFPWDRKPNFSSPCLGYRLSYSCFNTGYILSVLVLFILHLLQKGCVPDLRPGWLQSISYVDPQPCCGNSCTEPSRLGRFCIPATLDLAIAMLLCFLLNNLHTVVMATMFDAQIFHFFIAYLQMTQRPL